MLSLPEALAARHDVSGFSCGKPARDNWLKTRALSNQEKGFTVVMVMPDGGRARPRGFLPSKDDPLVLFRSLADIAASLEAAGIELPSSS